MIVTFLGTGAFDYRPELETTCRRRFDPDVRRSSCVLVDGSLLIDCGDWALNSLEVAGTDTARITDLLITHTHSDHCRFDHIGALAEGREKPLGVWCHASAAEYFPALPNCAVHTFDEQIPQTVAGARVTAFLANHRTALKNERPVHYLIEKDGKKFFYGCDGGWFRTGTFQALRDRKIDLFVFDGTVGDYNGDYRVGEHNSIPMVRLLLSSMKSTGVFAEGCKIYISHLAPSLHKPHGETAEKLAPEGILVARDGLTEKI